MTMIPHVLHFCHTDEITQEIQSHDDHAHLDKMVQVRTTTLQPSKDNLVQPEDHFVRLSAAEFWILIDRRNVSTFKKSAPEINSAANDEEFMHDITYWGA